jgi:hypothetical protein
MVPLSRLLMGFDNPFMPGWTFPPAIQDMQRWNGFSDTDVSSIAHQNEQSLYPLSRNACSGLKPPERPNTIRISVSRFLEFGLNSGNYEREHQHGNSQLQRHTARSSVARGRVATSW